MLFLNVSRCLSDEECIEFCIKNEASLFLINDTFKLEYNTKYPSLQNRIIPYNKREYYLFQHHAVVTIVSKNVYVTKEDLQKDILFDDVTTIF